MLAAVIMAGGSGERFWPLSTPQKPKQLLNIFSDKTMIRETVERILPIIPIDNIFIATNELHSDAIKKELKEISEKNIIIEPAFKDTAAAIGYSSLVIEEQLRDKIPKDEKLTLLVLASDHIIRSSEEFRKVILSGVKEAEENSVIVTLGVKPNRPETGYGYIELKEKIGIQLNNLYKVRKFREKPNLETAKKYVELDNYLWNSGMFLFSIDTIFKNFEVLMEEHTEIFYQIKNKIKNKDLFGLELANLVREDFKKFEKISIDFGLMEYSKNIKVIPVDFGWSDVGSFLAFEDIYPKKNENVTKISNLDIIDSKNNIIIAEEYLRVCLIGLNDTVVVKEGDNLLICSKNHLQEIKNIPKKNEA